MNKHIPEIYRTLNGPAYNQVIINRGNLCIWFDPNIQWNLEEKGKQGRYQTYTDSAIQGYLSIKFLFRLTLRMVTGFVQSLIYLCGFEMETPDYIIICRRQKIYYYYLSKK